MAEWLKAAVLKTASREPGRGFESYSLRHAPRRVHGRPYTLQYKVMELKDEDPPAKTGSGSPIQNLFKGVSHEKVS